MAPDPTVREATARDLPRLRAIQSATLAEPWPELLETAVDGPPVAVVVERPHSDGPDGYALVVPGDDVAYVAELAVAPARQDQGLGTRLLTDVLERLAAGGYETVRLTVRADDDRARSFYRNLEFSTVERVPDHYREGDGLLLERPTG